MRLRLLQSGIPLALSFVIAGSAHAQSGDGVPDSPGLLLMNAKSVAAKRRVVPGGELLRVQAASDPETVWVGHVSAGATYDYGPYHIGRGPWRPTQGGVPANTPVNVHNWDGIWGWDLYQPGENDSLMGWWPIKLPQWSTVGITNPPYQDTDRNRTWWALDHGNQLNYRSNAMTGGVPRTFGVAGLWHRDNGALSAPLGAAASPKWRPFGDTGASAWCGMRAYGDNSFVDTTPGVGNPFNGSIIQYNRLSGPAGGNWTALPGYTDQIDQMLFRDFTPSGAGHTLSFDYVSRMSTSVSSDPTIIHGWFNYDPLRQPNTANDRNYISATDNAGGGTAVPPVDSFMVYIGAPVNDASCTFSDGSVGAVYDPLRRWFSEVLDITRPITVIMHVGGQNGGFDPATGVLTPAAGSSGLSIQPAIDAVVAAGSPTVRLVFRVKTNRVGDDTDGAYDSQTAGAVILDNVVVGGTGGFTENFDSGGIDNTAGPASAFHSTGKPPAAFWHIHNLATLVYEDLCGPPDSPHRGCDIYGNVASGGNHDLGEAAGGLFGGPEQEQKQALVSPTINLVNGVVGVYNGMGIDEEIASRNELNLWYDMYGGRFNVIATGNTWSWAGQAYPVKQPASKGGTKTWGPFNEYGPLFNPDPLCFFDIEELYSGGSLAWDATASVSPSHPDSIRVLLTYDQTCFRFNVTGGCSPTAGMYIDNVSIGFNNTPAAAAAGVPRTEAVGLMSVSIWHMFQDAFPANSDPTLPGTLAFDTTAAQVKTGLNIAPSTTPRPVVPGDSSCVVATGSGMRVDLVFSIKPGPGNYVTAGNVASGLRRVPSSPAAVVSGDNSFWGQYEANNGEKGSPNTHALHAGGWDPDCWNSARMDTVERNFFPARQAVVVITPNNYMTTYFDTDPRGGVNGGGPGAPGPLAIARNKCFLINPAASNNSSNITCGNGTYPPAWTGSPGSGFDGNTVTYEYTKILPDGIFTPGTSVRYFFRKEEIASGQTYSVPDTNVVMPQVGESSTDGHRWQQFGVLPDRWKSTTYGQGLGGLCMLFVDGADRRGDERAWVSVMDSLAGNLVYKVGAHDGWHAVGNGADVNDPAQNRRPDGSVGFRSDNGGMAGTIFDMFGIKAAESLGSSIGAFGSRVAPAGTGLLAGHDARVGPTAEMLNTYYDLIVWTTGDLVNAFGPFSGRSSDDVSMIEQFLLAGTALDPKAVWIIGNDAARGEAQAGGAHSALLSSYFGLTYRGGYTNLSSNYGDCPDLVPTSPLSTIDLWGLNTRQCTWSNDVFIASTDPALAASPFAFYQAAGAGAPYIAGVRTDLTSTKHWKTVFNGFDIEDIHSRFCFNDFERRTYVFGVLVNLIGSICPLPASACQICTGVDDPVGPATRNYLRLASANPSRSGTAVVEFGVTQASKLEVALYDIVGRKVRVLASRTFRPGRYVMPWDGLDDQGRAVRQGVYFYRLKSPAFTSSGKLIVLQ